MGYFNYNFGDSTWDYSYSNISVIIVPLLDCVPDEITFTVAYRGDDAPCSMSCTVIARGKTLSSVSDTHQGNAKAVTYTLYIGQEITSFTNITINWDFVNAGIQTGDIEYDGILYKTPGIAPRIQYTVYLDENYYWKADINNDGYIWCGILADEEPFQGYDSSKPLNSWKIDTDNDGYAWCGMLADDEVFQGYDSPKPLNSWKIDANNEGYPWTWGFAEFVAEQNIFFKTTDGLVPLVAYYKRQDESIPLTFVKLT